LLPRKDTDFDGNNDDVYPALEKNEHALDQDLASTETERKVLKIPRDEDRKIRSAEEMETEALWLSKFFDAWWGVHEYKRGDDENMLGLSISPIGDLCK
jgi:bis(5'-adenosyl)-triphosphatase